MAMRLHEFHPVFAHFPMVLLPLSVASDVVGTMTDNRTMMKVGRRAMPLAVGAMALTAVTGVMAQEGVTASVEPGEAQDLLTTHRTMNLMVFGAAATLSVMRMRQNKPGKLYFGLAAGTLAALAYSGMLGGKMVYEHGVGVEAAGGVRLEHSPEMKLKNTGAIARAKVGNLAVGLARVAKSLWQGPRLPAMGSKQRRLQSEDERYYYSEKLDAFEARDREHDAAHHRYSDDDYGGLHS